MTKGPMNIGSMGRIAIVSCMIFFFLMTCGCDNTPAGYSYYAIVSGLENYTGNGATEILLPVPVINGSTFFTDENMMNNTGITQDHGEWVPRLLTTERGKMISLGTSEKNLTGANLRLYSNLTTLPYNESERAALLLNNTTIKCPLYPVAEQSIDYTPSVVSIPNPVNYTSIDYTYKYDTYVYIDQNITPTPDKDHRIRIYSIITIYEGSFSSSSGRSHSAVISETIPEGKRGWIPVTVYVF